MDIDTSIRRHLQNLFWQNLPKGNDNHNVRLIGSQLFHTLVFADPLWLVDLNAIAQSRFLYRWKLHFLSSALGLVRLCYHKDNLMPSLNQRFQRPHRKIRCSHKNDFHTMSQSFLHFFHIIMDSIFRKSHIHLSGKMINLVAECSGK